MDGAVASGLYRTLGLEQALGHDGPRSRRAVGVSTEVSGVSPDGAASGADLGGSSKYSNENFED